MCLSPSPGHVPRVGPGLWTLLPVLPCPPEASRGPTLSFSTASPRLCLGARRENPNSSKWGGSHAWGAGGLLEFCPKGRNRENSAPTSGCAAPRLPAAPRGPGSL